MLFWERAFSAIINIVVSLTSTFTAILSTTPIIFKFCLSKEHTTHIPVVEESACQSFIQLRHNIDARKSKCG
jgi:hypothetical protein